MGKAIYITNGNKKCSRCGQILSIEQFHKQHRAVSGYKSECKSCKQVESKKYHLAHKNTSRKTQQKRGRELKTLVLTHYGNGACRCVKCGFSDIRALSIDHIQGGGTQHRKLIKRSNLYYWLITQGYPKGYQTLCMNCQYIKRIEEGEWKREA